MKYFVLLYIAAYYGWILLWENETVLFIGSHIFQLAAPILSALWLFQAFKKSQDKGRFFRADARKSLKISRSPESDFFKKILMFL